MSTLSTYGIDKNLRIDKPNYMNSSQTSLPTMFHDEERPRNVWIEQLALANGLAQKIAQLLYLKRLSYAQKCSVFAVILGEDGLVWNMRIPG